MLAKPGHYVQLRVDAYCLVVWHDAFEEALSVPWYEGVEH